MSRPFSWDHENDRDGGATKLEKKVESMKNWKKGSFIFLSRIDLLYLHVKFEMINVISIPMKLNRIKEVLDEKGIK